MEPPKFDSELLEQVLTEEEDSTVIHGWLKEIEQHWYTVGFCLKVPKGKLDVIKHDYPFTSEQLIAMIHLSISGGRGITWKDLTEALKSCGHGSIVRLVLEKVNERFMKEFKLFKERLNLQTRDQRIRELMATSEAQKNTSTRKLYTFKLGMEGLQQLLSVPTDISEGFSIENIEFFINSSTVFLGFYKFSCHIRELSMNLQEYHSSLKLLADSLSSLSKELRQREVVKDELIREYGGAKIDSFELDKMMPEKRNGTVVTQACRTLIIRQISQSLEEDRCEVNTNNKMLNFCQTQLDEAVDRSSGLRKAVLSVKQSCSIYYLLLALIHIIVRRYMRLKFKWYMIVPTSALLILITSFSMGLLSRSSIMPFRLKVRVYRLLFHGKLKKILLCILFEVVASAAFLSERLFTNNFEKDTDNVSSMAYSLTTQYIYQLPLGIILGWKLFDTVLSISHHGIKCANLFTFFLLSCIISITMVLLSLKGSFLIGLVVGFVLNFIPLSRIMRHAMSVCLGLYLCYILVGIGIFFSQELCYLSDLEQFAVIGGAIASFIVTVFYISFNALTRFPTAIIEEIMEESIRTLDEDISVLNITRNIINESQHY